MSTWIVRGQTVINKNVNWPPIIKDETANNTILEIIADALNRRPSHRFMLTELLALVDKDPVEVKRGVIQILKMIARAEEV